VSPSGTFEVATPASWHELDLDPSTRRRSIALIVERSGEMNAVTREELARLLDEAAADAQAQGAVFAALYSDVLEDRPVSASLVVSVREGRGEAAPTGMNRSAVAQGLSRVLEGAGSVEVRDLPVGHAVRLRKRLQAPLPGQEAKAEVENVQWFVPSPDGRQLALLAFSTPTLGLAEPFGKLFDAIAGTVRWT
jgi:hypothetical protein